MARKAAAGRKGRRGKPEETELEVVEEDAPAAAEMGLETGLIFVTFVALVVAFVLVRMETTGSGYPGWPF